jgi:AcrR family transcriptional regulator
MKSTRPYAQRVRADRSHATHQRILEAVLALVAERGTAHAPLSDVAARAGVSVQTVLRRFGSAEGLRAQALHYADALIRLERASPVGDTDAAVAAVAGQYERRADAMLALLAVETTDATARRLTTVARAAHRAWVEQVWAADLSRIADPVREELTDLLVVATDLHTWRSLRRERGLSPPQTEARMRRLVRAVLADTDHSDSDPVPEGGPDG